MKHELPPLPYVADALTPAVSKTTIEFHYGKHHQAYVNNLNDLISGTPFEKMELEEIIRKSDGGIFNNAAQVFNHTFYFNSFKPGGSNLPQGSFSAAVNTKWGSLENFKKEFANAALTLFGSGWAWLVKNEKGELSIIKESNAGCPLTSGLIPILTFDVWEHAYYLDYQNRRADYIAALWNIVDWEKVASRY